MTAIILAAGVGKRLGDAAAGRPKCLVPIGGRPLLARLLEAVAGAGVREAVVVTGFGAADLRATLGAGPAGMRLRYLFNARFREGAILSLWTARDFLAGPVLVMDADVLCSAALVRRLVESPHENCFLMDRSSPNTGEEQMLLLRDGRVCDIVRGGAPGYEETGESIGFLKLSGAGSAVLHALLGERVARGQTDIEHEEVYPALLARVAVGVERVDGEPWIEVDFAEDVRRAEAEILPRIEAACA